MRGFLFVVVLGLCLCGQGSNESLLGIPQLSGPSQALVKQIVEVTCELHRYPVNETVLLKLYKKGDNIRLLGEYSLMDGETEGSFLLVIKPGHDGELECVASAQNNSNIESTISNVHYLKVVVPVEGAQIKIKSGSEEVFEGQELQLLCETKAGNDVSYKWLLNSQPITQSPGLHLSNNNLMISRTTSDYSGNYTCEATNHFNTTIYSKKSTLLITVKDLVSAPDISYTLSKKDFHYIAVVTCESRKGTPPITFSLYSSSELHGSVKTDGRQAEFEIPVILDQQMEKLQCQANNTDRIVYSPWIPFEVVSVGGHVKLEYDFHVGEDYAVIGLVFYCTVERGSHPYYQWFLNETLLDNRGGFYAVYDRLPVQSVLMLSVGRSSAGTYHCKVSNIFDNATVISSRSIYSDKEVLNRLPLLVVAVVFVCFAFVILLVSICCGIGVVYRQRLYEEKSVVIMNMERIVPAYEGELKPSKYNEDTDVIMTTGEDELDQASEDSVDEWALIEEEKKTLEDEQFEQI